MYFCVKSIHLFHVNFKNVPQELPGGAVDKKPPASAEDTGSILGPGRSHGSILGPGRSHVLQSS